MIKIEAVTTAEKPVTSTAASVSGVKRTGGGTFDPDEGPVNFVAATAHDAIDAVTLATHVLVALNELESPNQIKAFEDLLNTGRHKVFLDSGIYAINAAYMREHPEEKLSMRIPPDEMPGFHELRAKYVETVKRYEDRLWGYVELDQGGYLYKPTTRAALEAEGVRPIPVFHPMIDPPEYFDFLASQYDRICVGVPRHQFLRKRLYNTVWQRWQPFRHRLRWIHALGFSPSHLARALPFSSYDSSTWAEPMRWGVMREHADGKQFSQLPKDFLYSYEAAPESDRGSNKATRIAMIAPHMQQHALRHRDTRTKALGLDA